MIKAERESKPGRDISYCLDANYAKGTNTTVKSRRQLVMEIRESTDTENKESRIDQVHTIAYSKSHRDNGVIQARGKIDDEAIMEFLSELGYDLDFEVVNSKHFGLAQNRERVFIFGRLK